MGQRHISEGINSDDSDNSESPMPGTEVDILQELARHFARQNIMSTEPLEETDELDRYYDAHLEKQGRVHDPLVSIPGIDRSPESSLQPPISETVSLIDPNTLSIGSLMIGKVVRDGESIPSDAVCTWSTGDVTFCLQKRAEPRAKEDIDEDSFLLYHEENSGAEMLVREGVWSMGPHLEIFCKAKPWAEGVTTEADTIRWINKNIPSVPTPEVLYDWVDKNWNRSIMIMKRVPGQIYQKAWPHLTHEQRLHVADQVAGHLRTLSEWTSDYAETVLGTARTGIFSLREHDVLPIWKPRIEPRTSRKDYYAFLRRENETMGFEMPIPGAEEPLVLQHGFVTPFNFLVSLPPNSSQMPQVTGIIGWRGAGYSPKYEIATKPRVLRNDTISPGNLDFEQINFQWMLSNACFRLGLPVELDYVLKRDKYLNKHTSRLLIRPNFCLVNLPAEVKQRLEDHY
ncbi:hypothetical protein PVAG01_10299 [Phlyctema vagabunda]|uniref:Uncharacterized protein n=1 Tax=Phlyctema vagabunda TaxID=108571 RepID=A0ABR4P5M1_9HELO